MPTPIRRARGEGDRLSGDDGRPRLAAWRQPAHQLFRDAAAATGGLVALKVQHGAPNRIGAFVELEAKSAGWVAGTAALDRNLALRFGVSLPLS